MFNPRLITLTKAVSAQLFGFTGVWLVALLFPYTLATVWPVLALQAGLAALFSALLRQPPWWPVIHLLFCPLLVLLLIANLPGWIYLLLLMCALLVFWGTVQGDVPLFLSSTAVADTVADIIKNNECRTFAELGAGLGSMLPALRCRNPDLQVTAYEHAPLPWLICRWRSYRYTNIRVSRTSFWQCNLAPFDAVFAFLSPAVMPKLGEKIRREMRIGSLFISSSFPIPDWQPEYVITTNDYKQTKVYCYRL